jgi:hypothetical protein
MTLVLLLLGSGFGFASLSPWPNAGASAFAFTVTAGIWLIVTQWLSAALGGFITGRLRGRWVGIHTHEAFFRDTAHGFLTWALASLVGAAILGGVAAAALGTARSVATVAPIGVARQYGVEMMFRGAKPDGPIATAEVLAEATHILASGIATGALSAGDRTYLTSLVAARTGIPQAEAQKRVDDAVEREAIAATKLRDAADSARKSASMAGFFTALSMLIGAFIASAAAAYGGSFRDEHV